MPFVNGWHNGIILGISVPIKKTQGARHPLKSLKMNLIYPQVEEISDTKDIKINNLS